MKIVQFSTSDLAGGAAVSAYRLHKGLIRHGVDTRMLVVNRFRPLTRDAVSAIEVMREIEAAAGMRFTAVVNNSNLGEETTVQDVLGSMAYAREICAQTGLPLKFTAVREALCPALEGKIENLFPLTLQRKIT